MTGDLIRRGNEDTDTQRDSHVKTQGGDGRRQAKQRPALLLLHLGLSAPGTGEK